MIAYRRRCVNVDEVWFNEVSAPTGVDIVEYRQRPAPIKGGRCEPFHTRIVDLRRDPQEIFSEFKKDTRYEIRRAESKDELSFDWLGTPEESDVSSFCEFYDAFAATKSLAMLNRPHTLRYTHARVLTFSRMRRGDGTMVIWHAYLRGGNRARLLHSASLFREADNSASRSLTGRANRLLHWLDMQKLRMEGVTEYDLGGWYPGDTDRALSAINAFKEEFGGRPAIEYNAVQCVTLKGTLYALAARLLRGKKS